MSFIIRDAREDDLPAFLAIYNAEVEGSTATMDLSPVTAEERRAWFFAHGTQSRPLLAAECDGETVGYASLSDFRPKAGYRPTAELSVYVARPFRGQGIGRALMTELLRRAKEEPSLHTVVSVITGENEGSMKLHESLGFRQVGRIPEAGYKMGRYIDMLFYEIRV